jgi:hypothetical protein
LAVAGVFLALSFSPSFAQNNSNTVGTLICSYGTNVGMIIGSRQRMSCIFQRTNGDIESYSGTFTRVGLDVGVTGQGKLAWTVLARSEGVPPRALTGNYVGASAGAAVAFGAGANVLVGGSNQTISLQPVSLEVSAGAALAVGVGKLTLQ